MPFAKLQDQSCVTGLARKCEFPRKCFFNGSKLFSGAARFLNPAKNCENIVYNLSMSSIFQLYRLQQIDSQIDKAQRRLDEIRAILDDDAELRRAQGRLTEAEDALSLAEKTLQSAESEVRDQRLKIEQTEAILYGGSVKNPKEIQDLQKKSESLKRYLATLEDTQLEAMLEKDERVDIAKEAQAVLDALQAKLAQSHSRLRGEQSQLNDELDRLEKERKVALPEIDDDELKLYSQLRKRKRGVAVAAISDGYCAACGATLTPGLQQKARSTAKIVYCPSCQRILYGK